MKIRELNWNEIPVNEENFKKEVERHKDNRTFILNNVRVTQNVKQKIVLDKQEDRDKLPYLITRNSYNFDFKKDTFLFPNNNIIIVDIDAYNQKHKEDLIIGCIAYQETTRGLHLFFINDTKHHTSNTGINFFHPIYEDIKFDLRTSKTDGRPSTGVAFKGKIYYTGYEGHFSRSIFGVKIKQIKVDAPKPRIYSDRPPTNDVLENWLNKKYPNYINQTDNLHTTTWGIMSAVAMAFGTDDQTWQYLVYWLENNTHNSNWKNWYMWLIRKKLEFKRL